MAFVCENENENEPKEKKSHETSTIFTLYAMPEVESSMKIDSEQRIE